jgi:hypothetical protein
MKVWLYDFYPGKEHYSNKQNVVFSSQNISAVITAQQHHDTAASSVPSFALLDLFGFLVLCLCVW